MSQQRRQRIVLNKIAEVLEATAVTHADQLIEYFDRAARIFIVGVGRSKLVGNFLAMRLMHCGYAVNVVGEVVTTSILASDLLVVISGSGETEQLIALTKRAKRQEAATVLITAKSGTSLGNLVDEVFQIGNVASYSKVEGMPMGTTFELSSLCFLEAVVACIILEREIPEEAMQTRHANLE